MDHTRFGHLLQRVVDEQGNVDYEALRTTADTTLAPYLNQFASARPAPHDRDTRLAFWINAYNAFTLKLIVDHYPLKSIWDIDRDGGQTPFDLAVGDVADTVRTLDEIEHEIIRERFDEPRIHFALVCAAKSCPRLRRDAYTGTLLDEQLDAQARHFLHSDRKNHIPAGNGTVAFSRILKWYGSDFGPSSDALQRFAASYFEGSIRDSLARASYNVRFLPYDWTLNDQLLDWGDSDAGPPGS